MTKCVLMTLVCSLVHLHANSTIRSEYVVGGWDATSFKSIRAQGLKKLAHQLEAYNNGAGLNRIIIVDDTMHHRSMRREVFVITRDHNVPLLTVWIQTDLTVALQRLRARTEGERVSEDSFHRVCAQFERPDSSHICDRNHCVLSGESQQRCACRPRRAFNY